MHYSHCKSRCRFFFCGRKKKNWEKLLEVYKKTDFHSKEEEQSTSAEVELPFGVFLEEFNYHRKSVSLRAIYLEFKIEAIKEFKE